jgi:microcystin-dependent protein
MSTPSKRLGIPKPAEGDTPDVPRDLNAAIDFIDNVAMSVDVGPLSSRPPSSPSTPGTSGHAMVVTDQAVTGPRLDVDTGTGFFTVGPAPADAAANIPSSRTLGQGATQACAGNDPRLVGGATATGDVSGNYPGPLQVNTWNGQNKAQVVASAPPQAHGSSHLAGGTDPVTGLTDANIAASNKDGPAGTPGLRTLGTGAQQACAGNDPRLSGNPAPVGAIVPYAGTADPPEPNWIIADGRLIDRTTYSDFYARVGHTYNGNVDPGSNKVRIPDKRGKKSVGAINMGTGAGPNDNAHLQAVRGTSYGEVNHTLLAAESGTNGNGSTTPTSTDHAHAVSVSGGSGYSDQSLNHYHSVPNLNGSASHAFYVSGSGSTYTVPGQAPSTNTSSVDLSGHTHQVSSSGGTNWMSQQGYAASHSHGMNARNADNSHNNIDPCEADSYIVRIF